MQSITAPLTDEQLRQADAATRDHYLRVLTLVLVNHASWDIAAAAIQDADQSTQKESTTRDKHTH